jgi:Na+/proline symporter
MTFLDWAVVAAYLTYVIWDGFRLTRHAGDAEGYFLAKRSLPWWAVGLSVMATQLSAITLVSATGQGYDDGVRFVQQYFGLPLAMVILCVTVVPFFYRAKVFTAYEFLERRFDAKTRALTGFLFLVSRGLGVSVVIAAPSVILSVVFGWSETATIFGMGLTTTLYTMIGGVQAVTWTDVKQMAVIFVGMTAVLFIIIAKLPPDVSFLDGLHIAGATGRLRAVDWSLNFQEKYTFWSGAVGALFLFLAYFGCDQSQVQRFLTARSVGEGRTSLLMSAFVKIPMQFLILLIGVMVFVFYLFQPAPMLFKEDGVRKTLAGPHGAEYKRLEADYTAVLAQRAAAAHDYAQALQSDRADDIAAARRRFLETQNAAAEVRRRGVKFVQQTTDSAFNDVNYVFPTFVVKTMPPGIVGLIIAAIFAAAMSSVAAELNALATASVVDFYKRWMKPAATDAESVRAGRIATGFWGVFACFAALYSTQLGSLIEVVNRFGSFFYGSLLGVFVLAFIAPRANGRGAFWGLIVGMATVWAVSRTDVAFLWYNAVGCVTVVVVGFLISLTRRPAAGVVARDASFG